MKKKFFGLLFCLVNSVVFADQLIIEPDAGPEPVLAAIASAKSSVELSMYGLTDPRFVDALIKANKAHKTVAILLEPHPYRASDENLRAISALEHANMHLAWPANSFKLLHQKTLVLDHEKAVVMTFNFTHSTFNRERNFALIITDKNRVSEIDRVFLADYAHQRIAVNDANLVWSPDNSRAKILGFIRSAKSDIAIYAEDINDYQVVGALAQAAKRGVKVKILMSANSRKMHNGKFNYLRRAGVMIHNSDGLNIHAKVILVDGNRALLGSINLTTASMEDNRELSVITDDTSVTTQLTKTFEHDWT